MMLCSELNTQIQTWLRDYDMIQSVSVILIYILIGCSLIGSLGALYTGVFLVDLGISLFALVAIESSSQSLGRTYAFLLFSAILVDILWFILYNHEIWYMSSEIHGKFAIISIKITLIMQVLLRSIKLSEIHHIYATMRCNACWRELEGRAISTTCGHLLCNEDARNILSNEMAMAGISPQILMKSAYRSVMLYIGLKELEMQFKMNRVVAQCRQKCETMQEKFTEKTE